MSLKDKRILITAGPTWVAIDSVRVISNTATGETGILLAEGFAKLGAKVTLLIGPVGVCCLNPSIKLTRYRFFDELKDKLFSELKKSEFDCVIHSAAVSDYKPKSRIGNKISSGLKNLNIRLNPTEKIIDRIRILTPQSLLVGFKFEPNSSKGFLFNEAKKLINQAKLDMVVANTVVKNKYSAYIIDNCDGSAQIKSKNKLAEGLIRRVSRRV